MTDNFVVPPPELKEAIDKIADFVVSKGRMIEEKI